MLSRVDGQISNASMSRGEWDWLGGGIYEFWSEEYRTPGKASIGVA